MASAARVRAATVGAALRRAFEYEQTSPLCVDPLARLLVDTLASQEEQRTLSESVQHPHPSLASVCAFTRLADRWLEAPIWPPARTTRRQVVMLGSGLDARPYRLGISRATTLFEVDFDEKFLHEKHSVLKAAGQRPRCNIRVVGADPDSADSYSAALKTNGFDPSLPTRWVFERVLNDFSARQLATHFTMANSLGGAAGSGVAAHVSERVGDASNDIGQGANDSPAHLGVSGALRRSGWRNVQELSGNELVRACAGRDLPRDLAVFFADADEFQD